MFIIFLNDQILVLAVLLCAKMVRVWILPLDATTSLTVKMDLMKLIVVSGDVIVK